MNTESKERKKVLYLITKSNWGGAQRYVYDLATNLPANWEPVVMLGGDGELIAKLKEAGIRVLHIPKLQRDVSLKAELKATGTIYQLIKTERPDVLHVNSSKAGFLGALIGRISFVPRVIFTAHGWAFNENRPFWQRLVFKYFHWLTVMLAHHTIAVSSAIKKQLDWPFVQKRMTIIHNGRAPVAHLPQPAARAKLCEKIPKLSDHQTDLWTGTIAELHPVKQHEVMIEATARLRESGYRFRHVIIGSGEHRNTLEDLIKEKGLNDHVFFAGAIFEAARLLPAFDIFTLTSRSEALGYTVIEAAQAGLPIIASNVGGLPEVITNNTSGFLIPPRADAVASAIETLIDSPTLRERFGTAAKKAAAQKFSIDAMLWKTTALYSATMPRDSK